MYKNKVLQVKVDLSKFRTDEVSFFSATFVRAYVFFVDHKGKKKYILGDNLELKDFEKLKT